MIASRPPTRLHDQAPSTDSKVPELPQLKKPFVYEFAPRDGRDGMSSIPGLEITRPELVAFKAQLKQYLLPHEFAFFFA